MYLISYNGEVIHNNGDNYYTKKINDLNYDDIINVDIDPVYQNMNKEDDYIFLKEQPEFYCNFENFGKVTGIYNKKTRAVSFKNNDGKYLCFEGNNLVFTRDEANLWESFCPIDEKFIKKLQYVILNKWISKRTGEIFDGKNITFCSDFIMKIGTFSIDIRSQHVADFEEYKFIGFCDTWKFEEFLLYNPLIYITAYSSKSVLNQLSLCVRALRNFADFDGRIIVMSNEDTTSIRSICSMDGDDNIDVDHMDPKDFVGYVCSKFSILGKDIYSGYQPVMYLDPDIIFNSDLNKMLQEATLTEDICAPLEDFHRVQTHVPVGAGLIQLDSLTPSPYAAGFNGGTIIFPNTDNTKVKEFLDAARRSITNIGEFFGRDFNLWADQEVINYLSIKNFNINTSCISKYAKYVDHNPSINENLTGFVHFWGHDSDKKSELMKIYFDKVEYIRYKLEKS